MLLILTCSGWSRAGGGLAEAAAEASEVFGEPVRVAAWVEGVAVGEAGQVVEDAVVGVFQPFLEDGGEGDELAEVVGLVLV